MLLQKDLNYHRIAEAINFLAQNFQEQPDLDEVARKLHVSPFHFQRMFTEWAGVSPKKFIQYLTLDRAKRILATGQASLFDTAAETGLSGTGRLHDLFIKLEGMTPGEYKAGGENLRIHYSFAESPFGELLIASTPKGICYMAFTENRDASFNDLQRHFPNAMYVQTTDTAQEQALRIFRKDAAEPQEIRVHLKGSPFQLKVWEALLKIPSGSLHTYKTVANRIAQPTALRAVGTAIGCNPVAYIIPCHRVIQSAGTFGNYRWGSTRKTAIIGWEAAQLECEV